MGWDTMAELKLVKGAAMALEGTTLAFEVPNLDGVDDRDRQALEWVFGRLAAYCDAKGRACKMRLKGDIEAAVSFERHCDQLHAELPKWARW